MIAHLPSPRQDARSEIDNWLDLDALAGEIGVTTARQLLRYAHHVALDSRPIIEAESARTLLALEEMWV